MILKRKHEDWLFCKDEYFCELTEELDILSGLNKRESYRYGYKHYVYATDSDKKEHCYAIRVPGGTVGGIWVDGHNVIINIKIDRNYVVKTYSDELDAIIEKYIGKKIEFER